MRDPLELHVDFSSELFDSLFEPVVLLQPQRDNQGVIRDFTYAFVNRAACEYNGLAQDELLGHQLTETLPVAQSSGLLTAYAGVADTGRRYAQDHVLLDVPLKGGMRLSSTRCVRVGEMVAVMWQDVTEMTQARAEATAFSPEVGPVIDSQHDPHVVFAALRDLNGNIVDYLYAAANQAAAAYEGVTLDELVGSRVSDIVARSKHEAFDISHLSAVLNWGIPYIANDVSMLAHRDGKEEWRWHDQRVVKLDEDHLLSTWRDVSDRHPAGEQLADFDDPTALINEDADIICAVKEGLISWVSPSVETVLGWAPHDVLGQSPFEFVDEAGRDRVRAADLGHNPHGRTRIRLRLRGRSRTAVWVDLEGELRTGRGTELVVLTLRPVAPEALVLQLLEHQAREDGLTGLANRMELFMRLPSIIAAQQHAAGSVAVILFDLDEFKRDNESFGQAAGDALLREVARRLAAHTQSSDLVARVGDDEFAVVLVGAPHAQVAVEVARELQQLIAGPVSSAGTTLGVTASVGVAWLRESDDADSLIARADAAMFMAKRQGRSGMADC